MSTFIRIFFGIWSVLFLLFGYWQFNDPDPLLWISIYGYAAVMAAMAAMKRFFLPLLLLGVLLGIGGFFWMYPGAIGDWVAQEWQQQDLSMKTQHMEEAREAFGLLIVAVIMGVASLIGWRRSNKSSMKIRLGNS